jgi:hypothetical protein
MKPFRVVPPCSLVSLSVAVRGPYDDAIVDRRRGRRSRLLDRERRQGRPAQGMRIACAKAGQVLAILEAKTNKPHLIATENPGEDPNKGVIDFRGPER